MAKLSVSRRRDTKEKETGKRCKKNDNMVSTNIPSRSTDYSSKFLASNSLLHFSLASLPKLPPHPLSHPTPIRPPTLLFLNPLLKPSQTLPSTHRTNLPTLPTLPSILPRRLPYHSGLSNLVVSRKVRDRLGRGLEVRGMGNLKIE